MHGFVRDVIAEKGNGVFLIGPSASVHEAVHLMNSHGVGALVVAENARMVGILSERDVLRRVIGARCEPERTRVRDVMTRDVVTVTPDTPVTDAMDTITSRRVRHLPVVSGTGELAGILSIGDCMRWATLCQQSEIERMTSYVTGRDLA